ncbi:GlxA family transcriptional regulator [Thalassolituus sp. LLYu03]|uniref:GlxA family transcriptional regulator n=1 Tax=Thalassolituus sp. LLYu03 TaxID=3421656 RepID=UPI003D2D5EC6
MAVNIRVALLNYPESLKSALFGLQEMLLVANRCAEEQGLSARFNSQLLDWADVAESTPGFDLVVLPPSYQGQFYQQPDVSLLRWLRAQHQQGAVLASACAGAFLLAASGVCTSKTLTTHWALEPAFRQQFPKVALNTNAILLDEQDIISAGGMMSWVDLGLELVTRFMSASVMRQVGKVLVIDTAPREQRFYQQFSPDFRHGDELVLTVQKRMADGFRDELSVAALAAGVHVSQRTLLRRFEKATSLTPLLYLQRLRIQKVCDQLESSTQSFERIAFQVGYQDISACRKAFVRIMGLTPKAFRQRFAQRG